jgi:hypothetical protein
VHWDELLQEYRALGGVFENVRRDVGRRGTGLFPIDRRLQVVLHAPENLLVPAGDLQLRGGHIVVRPESRLGERERRLFESVHQSFGWSAGTFEALWGSQRQWSQLPDEVVSCLKNVGALVDPDLRFAEPSELVCLQRFLRSRSFTYKGRKSIMPVVDFVNHSSGAAPFVVQNGVGVRGTFSEEVLVRYNAADSWANALTYGFADNSPVAYSILLSVELFGQLRFSIGRDIAEADVDENGIRYPRKRVDGNTIHLSFLLLGNARQPDLPRGTFRKVMAGHLTSQQADEVFDSVSRFNASKFLGALRTLRKHDAPLVRVFEDAAINQLDAISASVGARSL